MPILTDNTNQKFKSLKSNSDSSNRRDRINREYFRFGLRNEERSIKYIICKQDISPLVTEVGRININSIVMKSFPNEYSYPVELLQMMDKSVKNFNRDKVSEPIDFDELDELLDD